MDALPYVLEGPQPFPSSYYSFTVLQQVQQGKAIGNAQNERIRATRWPIEPPPVVELIVKGNRNGVEHFAVNPHWFATVELIPLTGHGHDLELGGTTVSSIHKLKMRDNRDRALFVFGDLYVKYPGEYRLKFSAFEMRTNVNGPAVEKVITTESHRFKVSNMKDQLKPLKMTDLSRELSERGIKLRSRKETTRRRTNHVDWTADSGPLYRGEQSSLPASNMSASGAPSEQNTRNSHAAGMDVSQRLSIGNGLGLRTLIDNSEQSATTSRTFEAVRRSDSWHQTNQSAWAHNQYAGQAPSQWSVHYPAQYHNASMTEHARSSAAVTTEYGQYGNGGGNVYQNVQSRIPPPSSSSYDSATNDDEQQHNNQWSQSLGVRSYPNYPTGAGWWPSSVQQQPSTPPAAQQTTNYPAAFPVTSTTAYNTLGSSSGPPY